MSVFAVVPVQRLDLAKSRLAATLTPDQRRALVLALLHNVLNALNDSAMVDRTLVVSPDPDVLDLAPAAAATPLRQTGQGLNRAICQGRDYALQHGAAALLIVLADLPFLRSSDIDALLRASAGMAVTLAPDRHGRGTNALVLRPPDAIEPAFGIDSFRTHRRLAASHRLAITTFPADGTAFDVDTHDDLSQLGQATNSSPSLLTSELFARPTSVSSTVRAPRADD